MIDKFEPFWIQIRQTTLPRYVEDNPVDYWEDCLVTSICGVIDYTKSFIYEKPPKTTIETLVWYMKIQLFNELEMCKTRLELYNKQKFLNSSLVERGWC